MNGVGVVHWQLASALTPGNFERKCKVKDESRFSIEKAPPPDSTDAEARCYTFRGLKPEIHGPRGHSTPADGGKVLHAMWPFFLADEPVLHGGAAWIKVALPEASAIRSASKMSSLEASASRTTAPS